MKERERVRGCVSNNQEVKQIESYKFSVKIVMNMYMVNGKNKCWYTFKLARERFQDEWITTDTLHNDVLYHSLYIAFNGIPWLGCLCNGCYGFYVIVNCSRSYTISVENVLEAAKRTW